MDRQSNAFFSFINLNKKIKDIIIYLNLISWVLYFLSL
ncbi:hypothetical protein CFF8240_0962 [Campylobacter fetus subsp. fetus 82-40]|uniref:Uncharacterized protein n=1 Tax=Campylobacter fetus subsp. fetus (strain 82-40) TaxID=360106 RepID=A0RPJ7_CAMFF|nr:hypothetical protein CFF8240_0962 [Campylobacter fetus subsp. fetus 82-40]